MGPVLPSRHLSHANAAHTLRPVEKERACQPIAVSSVRGVSNFCVASSIISQRLRRSARRASERQYPYRGAGLSMNELGSYRVLAFDLVGFDHLFGQVWRTASARRLKPSLPCARSGAPDGGARPQAAPPDVPGSSEIWAILAFMDIC